MSSKHLGLSAIALSISLAITGCDSNDQETSQESSTKAKVETVNQTAASQSTKPKVEEHSNSQEKNAVEPPMVFNIYNKEDTAGKVTVEQNGNVVKSNLELGWNNRRVNIDETIVLGEDGYVISQEVSGTSAFGAPIKESFSMSDGKAEWKSLNEQGNASAEQSKFYIPSDSTGVSSNYLVKVINWVG